MTFSFRRCRRHCKGSLLSRWGSLRDISTWPLIICLGTATWLSFDNIGGGQTERKSSCFPISLTSSSLVTEINMAEYGSCCKQREELVNKSLCNSRESILCRSWSTISILHYIYFCEKRTTMTSETSENTIFVRFYLTVLLSNANPPHGCRGFTRGCCEKKNRLETRDQKIDLKKTTGEYPRKPCNSSNEVNPRRNHVWQANKTSFIGLIVEWVFRSSETKRSTDIFQWLA